MIFFPPMDYYRHFKVLKNDCERALFQVKLEAGSPELQNTLHAIHYMNYYVLSEEHAILFTCNTTY